MTIAEALREGEVTLGRPRSRKLNGCLHCGARLGPGGVGDFCCRGCREVHRILTGEQLDRYYELQGQDGQPVVDIPAERADDGWLDQLLSNEAASGFGAIARRYRLDIQGIHCVGCVWLIDEVFRREPGALSAVVNPTLGTLELNVEGPFDLRPFVERVQRLGYRLGPGLKRSGDSELLTRMGVSIAIALNAMIFAISIYAGLREGPLFQLFNWLNFGLATASVVIGGPVFFRGAWAAMSHGVLHMDLPISLGIALSYLGSTYSLLVGNPASTYFDTVAVFIALMLVGRFVQRRVIDDSRARLLSTTGVDSLSARVVRQDRVEVVSVSDLAEGDVLLLSPGDVLPVSAEMLDAESSISLAWISGESESKRVRTGEPAPAGATLSGDRPVRFRAREPFSASNLLSLMRAPAGADGDAPHVSPFWAMVSKRWTIGVLTAAALGFAGWMLATGDLTRALDVVVAVLVVTCPCAIGIAAPLGYELVQSSLRREGLMIREPDFLDRATAVRKVVFDKTGTLTTGELTLARPDAVSGLDEATRQVLYNLAARSAHPKAAPLRRAAAELGATFDPDIDAAEHPGCGIETTQAGPRYRLGSAKWASPAHTAAPDVVVLSRDEIPVAQFALVEELRPDACSEVDALAAAGLEVWILSGDRQERVRAIAADCGVPRKRAIGEASPEGKAAWLRARDRGDTLMIGDGINDTLAVSEAHCSGTAAIDRPFVAARSDFYLVSSGLRPVRMALTASHRLARVLNRNLKLALAYNGIALSVAFAGLMSPLLCAVLMPASSLVVVAATTFSLSGWRSSWKS